MKIAMQALQTQPAPQTHTEASQMSEIAAHDSGQLLHLVLGGELKTIDSMEFKDTSEIDIVGVFPNYESAEKAWRAKAQATVDSAQTRYFIVHLHRMMAPAGLTRRAG
jgi:hypothetical protein